MVRVWDCVGEDMNTKGEFGIISGTIKDLAWDGESKRIIAVGDGKERYFALVFLLKHQFLSVRQLWTLYNLRHW